VGPDGAGALDEFRDQPRLVQPGQHDHQQFGRRARDTPRPRRAGSWRRELEAVLSRRQGQREQQIEQRPRVVPTREADRGRDEVRVQVLQPHPGRARRLSRPRRVVLGRVPVPFRRGASGQRDVEPSQPRRVFVGRPDLGGVLELVPRLPDVAREQQQRAQRIGVFTAGLAKPGTFGLDHRAQGLVVQRRQDFVECGQCPGRIPGRHLDAGLEDPQFQLVGAVRVEQFGRVLLRSGRLPQCRPVPLSRDQLTGSCDVTLLSGQ
jgi:hypothetical protein